MLLSLNENVRYSACRRIHSRAIYFEKLTFVTALSALIASSTKHWGEASQFLSLLRLTGDKSFNAD